MIFLIGNAENHLIFNINLPVLGVKTRVEIRAHKKRALRRQDPFIHVRLFNYFFSLGMTGYFCAGS